MAGEQNILREYLVALGFKVDEKEGKKFDARLAGLDKKATKLAKGLIGVGVAAGAMATEFAFRMEKLYYSSKLAQSAAGNLQAINFAGKQIGVQNMEANIRSLAASIRSNPGIQGLINSLGIKVTGRDMSDVATDIVAALSHMPSYVREKYGALFGWSPDDIQLMVEGLGKLKEAAELRKEVMRGLGVDTEAAAKAGLEYAQQWREILMYVGAMKDTLALVMLGPMHELAEATKEVLTDWIQIIRLRGGAAPGAQGVTAASAKASGLSLSEQQEQAKRLGEQPKAKGYYEMTPAERTAKGMPEDDNGKPWTVWDYLTPAERKDKGLPQTEGEMSMGERFSRSLKHLAKPNPAGGVELSDTSKERLGQDRLQSSNPSGMRGWWDKQWSKVYSSKPRTAMDPAAIEAVTAPDRVQLERDASGSAVAENSPPNAVITAQEKAKGLPTGFLDYIWDKESKRSTRTDIHGPVTRSGEQAQGPFQFMKGTADQYGVKDPQNFGQAAPAAASYLKDLIDKYGDLRFAAAAYNWGSGNLDKLMQKTMAQHGDWSQDQVDKFVLGHLPEETRKYVAGLDANGVQGGGSDVNVNANTTIHVHEAKGAKEAADAISENQRQVFGEIARNFSTKLR